ncbi:trypsin II-P29-like [Anopheles aquasalis]|uniref:trypsin II-P29-like n=1 Tax=Anopheles aquasalis TaxID=42839 RepID=UPI00215B6951|nr:trypsin II-P29-like [Anopheles aquasalis]
MRIKDTEGFHCVDVNRNQSDNVTPPVTHHGDGTVVAVVKVKLLDDKGYYNHNFGLNAQPPRLLRSIPTPRKQQHQQQRNGKLKPPGTGSKNAQIVGGWSAEEGDAPFIVSLRNMVHEREHGFGTGLYCGGSLINAHLVLTAAHCLIVEPPNLAVVAGVLNRYDRSARMQSRTVLSYLVPPEWDRPTLFADIGLIALDKPFELKGPDTIGSVQPIALPTSTPQEGTRCMLYGWGKALEDHSGRLYFPNWLQKAEVAVLNFERCNQSISIMLHVPGGTLCAGRYEGRVDSCQGDSGGPLVCGDTPTVAGIVSFGWKCGLPGYPGIYTDVFQYREWLQLSIESDPHTWYKGSGPVSRWNARGIASVLVIATLLHWHRPL